MSADQGPVEVDPVFGCWLWLGRKDKRDGRPLVWRGKSPMGAHRVVYEAEVGPVAVGMELDHVCRRPTCVYPAHLEPVSRQENERRKGYVYRMRRLSCRYGHPMAIHAMMTPEGGRLCRACSKGMPPHVGSTNPIKGAPR
jgi:hypothetical protein